jgi:hypothetical protein
MSGDFARDLVGDQMIIAFLWRPDGSQAASIVVVKEIWANIGNRPDIPVDVFQYPVFHLYNYVDSTKSKSGTGCRVNPSDQPFMNPNDAIALAEQHVVEALASGKWVNVEDVRTTA